MAEAQRPYLRSHPLAYFFALGIALTGILSILGFTEQDATAVVLPPWLQTGFQVAWAIGGSAAFYGIAARHRDFEALGATFIGGGLLILAAAIVYLDPRAARVAGLAFIFTLAIGCFLRAVHLALSADPYTDVDVDVEEVRQLLDEAKGK